VVPEDGMVWRVDLSAVLIDENGRPATLNFNTDITRRDQAMIQFRGIQEWQDSFTDLAGVPQNCRYGGKTGPAWNGHGGKSFSCRCRSVQNRGAQSFPTSRFLVPYDLIDTRPSQLAYERFRDCTDCRHLAGG